MRFWRKKNEGFEWREYVRTTILVRRHERKQRIHEAKDAALFGVKKAGRSGWQILVDSALGGGHLLLRGARSACGGLLAALGHMARGLAHGAGVSAAALGGALSLSWSVLARGLSPAVGFAGGVLGRVIGPVLDLLERSRVRKGLLIIGGTAAAGATGRAALVAADGEAMSAALIAAIAFSGLALPAVLRSAWLSPVSTIGYDLLRSIQRGVQSITAYPAARYAAAAAMLLLVGAAAWNGLPHRDISSALETAAITRAPVRPLEGRLTALTGDSVRSGSAVVKIAGIEAPERDQLCTRADGRTWRCGAAAREALERRLRGRRIACTLTGDREGETAAATCSADGRDIAEDLVREGHVFAAAAIFSGYGSIEEDARRARRGLWFGEALRPAEYRAQKWAEAKKVAPAGCPIKGQVSGEGRVYVLPWAAAYERVKIRETRGERWFCSEDEARAAGWRPTERS